MISMRANQSASAVLGVDAALPKPTPAKLRVCNAVEGWLVVKLGAPPRKES